MTKKDINTCMFISFLLGPLGVMYTSWKAGIVLILISIPAIATSINNKDALMAVGIISAIVCLLTTYVSYHGGISMKALSKGEKIILFVLLCIIGLFLLLVLSIFLINFFSGK